MKKLLMASAVLFLFSASIMMFQISCSKTANAGISGTTSQGKIISVKSTSTGIVQVISTSGTKQDIALMLPSGLNEVSDKYFACDGTYIWTLARNQTTSLTFQLLTFDMSGNLVKNHGAYSIGGDVIVAF